MFILAMVYHPHCYCALSDGVEYRYRYTPIYRAIYRTDMIYRAVLLLIDIWDRCIGHLVSPPESTDILVVISRITTFGADIEDVNRAQYVHPRLG